MREVYIAKAKTKDNTQLALESGRSNRIDVSAPDSLSTRHIYSLLLFKR